MVSPQAGGSEFGFAFWGGGGAQVISYSVQF